MNPHLLVLHLGDLVRGWGGVDYTQIRSWRIFELHILMQWLTHACMDIYNMYIYIYVFGSGNSPPINLGFA